MKINSITLENFRNYEKLELNFNKNINIIYGNNGVGKTNLVEAIYVLGVTKSFRTNNDKNLIKNNELYTKIEGVVEGKEENSYQLIINKEGKKVQINNSIVSKLSEYLSNIHIVLLTPDEHVVLSNSPEKRRRMLNIAMCSIEKEYIVYLNHYNKILKQRNCYLKDLYNKNIKNYDYLDILTEKLISYGIKVYNYRKDFINEINKYIGSFYNIVFEEGNLEIKYVSNYNKIKSDELLNYYKSNYEREIYLGKTLYGIHHDDLEFILDKKNISEWGSNGQQKNAILSFKLSEIEVIKNKNNTYPILILDDLFSALDNKKIKNIFKLFDKDFQIFITTTELKKIDKKIVNNAKLIKIDNGVVMEG